MRVFASQTSEGGERQEVPNRNLAVSAAPLSTMWNHGALVQRNCLCGGSCSKCQSESRIQPKLKVGAPNDKYEQEADRVAEQIVSNGAYSSTGHNPTHNSIQRMCNDCEEEEQAEENSVQRKSDSARDTRMPSRTESYIESLSVGGSPLSRSEAQYYEPRFGHSFSKIRVHTDEAADRAANSINARAFTLGNNIAFARGEHDFSSASGRKLMAHELAHTLQQSKDSDSVQRGSAGVLGGTCCNPARRVEWALVGAGVWKKLESGECTGTSEDCDGMTCGGGFYHVNNLQRGNCSTPRRDDATFAPRRWTPSSAAASATSPTSEGSTQTDTPPNYVYDAAATSQCPNGIRTITVDSIRLHGATQSPSAQLATANTAYSGCCVRFVAGATPPQESEATTKSWLGGDTDLSWEVNCGGVNAEETSMFDGATRKYNLSSRMRVFYVATMTPTTALAKSLPSYCATGGAAPYLDHVEVNNGALSDTLAHEFGHILLDSGQHSGIDNPADTRNVMFAPGRTASDLDTTQCSTIFGNA
jgi:Domain of unknown function (DUF4157)